MWKDDVPDSVAAMKHSQTITANTRLETNIGTIKSSSTRPLLASTQSDRLLGTSEPVNETSAAEI